jgi:phenylalanyl-tRNA synthetase alpha chain
MTVAERIEELREEALSAIASAGSSPDLESVRVKYLGRSADLTEIKKSIRDLSPEDRKTVGGAANRATKEIEGALAAQMSTVAAAEREEQLRAEAVDVTLPGVPYPKGSLHPSLRVIDEVVDFFVGLGYGVAEGPEVETDYYNFTALNIPPGHPARGMQDTFFLDDGLVLRTHTSPVQIRTMLSQEPPVYVVCPGRTYRRDSDPTHTPMFNQIEGLAVDKGSPWTPQGDARGDGPTRLRRGREGQAEAELLPVRRAGGRARRELLRLRRERPELQGLPGRRLDRDARRGYGRPRGLTEVGYDPEEYTGFAFGMGPDRMAMVKYGVPDLRLFFEGDLRFLPAVLVREGSTFARSAKLAPRVRRLRAFR